MKSFLFNLALGSPMGVAVYLFGGWDTLFQSLLVVIALDLISGVTAAIYQKNLASHDFLRGVAKKTGYIMAVVLAVQVEGIVPTIVIGGVELSIRTALITALVGGEMLSVAENLALAGVKLPNWFTDKLRIVGKED